MKKLALFLTLFVCIISTSFGQKVKRDKNGNFYTETRIIKTVTPLTYTNKRGIWPVFISEHGLYYAEIVSANGKIYKKYLHTEKN